MKQQNKFTFWAAQEIKKMTFLILFFLLPMQVLATSAGPNSPGTIVEDDGNSGTVTWNTPENAALSDDQYATSDVFSHTPFDYDVRLVKSGSVDGDYKAYTSYLEPTDSYSIYGGESDLWGLSLSPADTNASNFGVVVTYCDDEDESNWLKATNFGFTVPIDTTIDGVRVGIEASYHFEVIDPFPPPIVYEYNVQVDHISITVYYTESSGNTITAAPSDTSVVLASNDSTDVTSEAQTGTQTIRLKYGAETPKPVVDFPFDFDTGNTDLSSLTINRDDSLKAAVIHGLASHTGVTAANISLYIPKDSDQNYLRYCSGKTTIGCTIQDNWSALFNEDGDVVSTNNGFNPGSLTVTVTSINGEDLWKITGPISSGGQGEAGVPDIKGWALILLITTTAFLLHTHKDSLNLKNHS